MKTIAIYPGSFNPFHIGHLNILEKAERMFDEVIVAVGQNPTKPQTETYISLSGVVTIVSDKPRHEVLSSVLNRKVESYVGYLSEYIKNKIDKDTRIVLVRGLRNGDDLDYEINQLRVIEDLMGKDRLNVVFIACDKEYEHISSTVCRQMEVIEKNSSLIYYPKI
jgi:pantetheine-phosphate adenylyltransferase